MVLMHCASFYGGRSSCAICLLIWLTEHPDEDYDLLMEDGSTAKKSECLRNGWIRRCQALRDLKEDEP